MAPTWTRWTVGATATVDELAAAEEVLDDDAGASSGKVLVGKGTSKVELRASDEYAGG